MDCPGPEVSFFLGSSNSYFCVISEMSYTGIIGWINWMSDAGGICIPKLHGNWLNSGCAGSPGGDRVETFHFQEIISTMMVKIW